MSEGLIIAAILYGGVALCFPIVALINYGIYEHNLLRSIIKAAAGIVWPIVLIVMVRRWFVVYMKTQFKREWQEIFPVEVKGEFTPPPKTTIADLSSPKSAYKPGQWVN